MAGVLTKITKAIERVDSEVASGLPPGTYEDKNGKLMAKVN